MPGAPAGSLPAATQRVRTFIALDVDPAVRAALGKVQRELAGAGAAVRWVRPAGLHCTVEFLGALDAGDLRAIRAALGLALADQPGLRLRVRGLGVFPSWQQPRVLWAGLTGERLGALARAVKEAVRAAGQRLAEREFHGHITLGRLRGRRGWARLQRSIEAYEDVDFGETEVRAVTVYRSSLQPGGSIYTPLWRITLGEQ